MGTIIGSSLLGDHAPAKARGVRFLANPSHLFQRNVVAAAFREKTPEKRPVPMATWPSVLECSEWELKKAIASGNKERATRLRKTIATAKQHVQAGDLFPVRL
jgi:hypothetical protein